MRRQGWERRDGGDDIVGKIGERMEMIDIGDEITGTGKADAGRDHRDNWNIDEIRLTMEHRCGRTWTRE